MNLRKRAAAAALGIGLFGGMIMSPAMAETLKIGVVAPLTGPGATWGIAMSEGAKIAAADVNAAGGLDVAGTKYQVEVIAYDDQYKAAEAVAAYNRLTTQDGVKYIMTLSSASTLALKDSIENDGVIAVTGAYSQKIIDDKSKYVFRAFSTSHNFLPPFAKWMAENRKERHLVILNPNDETGWDQSQLSEKSFKDAGFEVVANELYERSQKEFQPLITKIMALDSDVIDFASSPPATVGLFVRQARELGYKGLFIKTSASGPREIIEAAGGKEPVEGMINLLFLDPAKKGDYERVAALYREHIGQEPNEILAPYYDGARSMLRAIAAGGDVNDTAKVSAAFKTIFPADSVLGDQLNYGPQQILTTHYISEVRNGEPVVIGKVQ